MRSRLWQAPGLCSGQRKRRSGRPGGIACHQVARGSSGSPAASHSPATGRRRLPRSAELGTSAGAYRPAGPIGHRATAGPTWPAPRQPPACSPFGRQWPRPRQTGLTHGLLVGARQHVGCVTPMTGGPSRTGERCPSLRGGGRPRKPSWKTAESAPSGQGSPGYYGKLCTLHELHHGRQAGNVGGQWSTKQHGLLVRVWVPRWAGGKILPGFTSPARRAMSWQGCFHFGTQPSTPPATLSAAFAVGVGPLATLTAKGCAGVAGPSSLRGNPAGHGNFGVQRQEWA